MIMRYNDRTADVFVKAYETAMAFDQDYIGSEHLIAGILAEGSGDAFEALNQAGLTYDIYMETLARVNGRTPRDIEVTDKTSVENLMQLLTPRTKRVLEMAIYEGNRRGQDTINPEHLLAGILREGQSVGYRVLVTLGIDIKQLYINLFRQASAGNSAKSGSGIRNMAGGGSERPNRDSDTPTLDQYGKDLTQMVRDQKIDPVIGRSDEINRVMQILVRRTKNNPVLIGEPGVGKTAIAEGLATKIIEGDMPDDLKDKRLIALDLTSMVAGAKYRGEFEERIEKALNEAIEADNTILFIDELHMIVGAGGGEGSLDVANILKPLLARGELQIIGATTIDEYRKYIEKDKALSRRFQPVMVEEPSPEDSILILQGLKDKYEAHHGVKITDEAIKAAVNLSVRYITDRFLPDKAIDLIDEGCSKIRLSNFTEPDELRELEVELRVIEEEKQEAAEKEEFEQAAELRKKELQLEEKRNQLKTHWKRSVDFEHNRLTEETIANIVSDWTGIPVTRLTEEDQERLKNLDAALKKRVIGQDEAVEAVSRAIRRGRLGLKNPSRPVGSFIFMGTTGVGKTELAKALAIEMFGDEKALIRFDMSEYMEKFDVNKFIGSPPGYVGYEESGQLTEAVRRRPYSVILFDEIEKAHPDIFHIMLQILDDGRLTDGQGRTVDFRNTIIIMTSNIGARLLTSAEGRTIGFAQPSDDNVVDLDENLYGGRSYEEAKELVLGELKQTFNPEFLNRVDDIVFFHMLSQESMEAIVEILLKQLTTRLKDVEIRLQPDHTAVSWIAKEGADIKYGARPLNRKIQTDVEDRLAELMLDGVIERGDMVSLSADENGLVFTPVPTSLQTVASDDGEKDKAEVEAEEHQSDSEA
jgi:ATP-dependent Clp protease ATP-binding subunit ClpC